MLIWIVLFLAVFLLSVVLALKSMNDYREHPLNSKLNYSIFLIGNLEALTPEVFSNLYQATLKQGLVLSFEKLFKGSKKALVIYGPTQVLKSLSPDLGLVELEDYTIRLNTQDNSLPGGVLAWEAVIKDSKATSSDNNLFEAPRLSQDEEIWYQMVLQPQAEIMSSALDQVSRKLSGKKVSQDNSNVQFKAVIRVVVWAKDLDRSNKLKDEFSQFGKEHGLVILPQTYSIAQIIKFYQDRVLPFKTNPLEGQETKSYFNAQELNQLLTT